MRGREIDEVYPVVVVDHYVWSLRGSSKWDRRTCNGEVQSVPLHTSSQIHRDDAVVQLLEMYK